MSDPTAGGVRTWASTAVVRRARGRGLVRGAVDALGDERRERRAKSAMWRAKPLARRLPRRMLGSELPAAVAADPRLDRVPMRGTNARTNAPGMRRLAVQTSVYLGSSAVLVAAAAAWVVGLALAVNAAVQF